MHSIHFSLRRLFSCALALGLGISCCACGTSPDASDSQTADTAATTTVGTTTAEQTPVATTEATTEAASSETTTDTAVPEDVFFDDFTGDTLDTEKWTVRVTNWGGKIETADGGTEDYNGGIIAENVQVSGGSLLLTGHGDLYEGDVLGIASDKTPRANGKRAGGGVSTTAVYASGSYEVRAKIAPVLGACSAIWTYEYEWEEETQHEVNHEIDIEFPGRPTQELANWDFSHVLLTNWVGVKDFEYTSKLFDLGVDHADGEFHTYRFDWHTGDESTGEKKRVEWYFDGELVYTSTKYVPTNAGNLWLALWFPRYWAGTPDFDTSVFEIDYVKITPFHEAGDVFPADSE